MSAEAKLKELNITLPEVTKPVASYLNAVRSGNLLYLSGGLPDLGLPEFRGKVPTDVTPELAKEAAREAILGRLAVIKAEVGSLDAVKKFVSLQAFVNAETDFTDVPQVINGASDTLVEIFGQEIGSHSRTAVGVASLPLNVCVEIALVVELLD
ncbi:MAG: RidA family protein [Verrucomicrobiota bacterium JB023]|nr:RidA family protein [Verrucomicrobiota bacterium JB023]